MAFGGSVKLTGESEYRQALQRCTQSLQSMSSALKTQTSSFSASDKSIQNSVTKQKELNDAIEKQQKAINSAKSTLAGYSTEMQKQTTLHNQLNKEYKNAVIELDKIKKSSGESSNEYKKQAQVVAELGNKLTNSAIKLEENKSAMASLKSEINNSNKTIAAAKKELDELGKEAEDSGEKAKKGGDGFTVFKGILSNLATQGINVAINGIKKLSSAVLSVGKQAINSYAEYEQLVGGVETLFKDAAPIVEDFANKAYKTAGLSANEYMETVTSFSASLLQSLGNDTKKAAEYSDRAITDMSDNANKMGTNIGMIQNAYQGFAKQNYTMLDNLKLGYGGTKTEMERLIKDASKMTKVQKELNVTVKDGDMSFGNIVNAISVVQKEMGIMGTTSKEASSTIQGSVNSMKASWKNLLTSIADDNQDMGKSVDEFVDSTVTAANNLVPRIKQAVNGIKQLINSIVTEVFPKLKREIPELRPLIETFEWFIDHKSLVVNSLKVMIGAFAIAKINSFTKSLSNGAKGLLDIVKNSLVAATAQTANTAATTANTAAQTANTAAQVIGATATKGLAAATNLLNAAWKANPIGLVITGITALVSVVNLLKNKTDENVEAQEKEKEVLDKQTNALERNKGAWEDLEKEKQNAVNTVMTELSHYESLAEELDSIVDKNGKVKKGYEERASFITSTLAEALGVEIKNVDGVIQNYDKLKNKIDEVMEKKKAQILLDSQESLYSEAITKQQEAIQGLIYWEDQIKTKKSERSKLEKELAEAEKNFSEASGSYTRTHYYNEKMKLEQKLFNLHTELVETERNYADQQDLYSKYTYNIGQYEKNMALAHAERYDEMTNVNWEFVKEFEKSGNAEKAQLEEQIKLNEYNLNWLKNKKKETGSEIYDQQIKDAEKLLSNQKENLKKYTEATDSELNRTEIVWSDSLDEQLSEITGRKIEFKEVGKGNVQMYADGVKQGKPKSKEEMAKLVTESIKEITKKANAAKKAGEDLIEGVNKGVKNQDKQNGVFSSIANFGSKLLGKLKSALKEKSPSKATQEMGQFLLEGLGIGMKQEENSVLNQASSISKNVIATLQDGLNQNVKIGNIQSELSSSSINSNANNYNNVLNAFKDALSDMTVEMDDEVMGKFVDKTVSRTIYS